MLTLTSAASTHLSKVLDDIKANEEEAVRVILDDDGFTLELDSQQSEDITFAYEGKTVLLLDDQLSELLSENTLDIEQTEEGPALTLI